MKVLTRFGPPRGAYETLKLGSGIRFDFKIENNNGYFENWWKLIMDHQGRCWRLQVKILLIEKFLCLAVSHNFCIHFRYEINFLSGSLSALSYNYKKRKGQDKEIVTSFPKCTDTSDPHSQNTLQILSQAFYSIGTYQFKNFAVVWLSVPKDVDLGITLRIPVLQKPTQFD